MSLTVKQRATINAALCTIHDSGHDAKAVTVLARSIMATGVNPNTAYRRALNDFADNNPAMSLVLSKVVRLVEASDHRTTAQYDVALSNYIATGDDSGLKSLAPMIAQDMTTLAVQHGEEPPQFDAEFTQGTDPQKFAFNTDPAPAPDTTASQLSLSQSVTGMVAPRAAREAEKYGYTGFAPTSGPGANAPSFAAAKEAARAAAVNHGRAIIAETPQGA